MPHPIENRKLVIFDCDGVLVDSERLSNQALVDCLPEHRIEMTVDDAVLRFKGRNLSECLVEVEAIHNCRLPKSFETVFRKRRCAYFEAMLEPIPGIGEALEAIKHLKCVASNGPLEMI